ncbi:OmpA family protein [Vibrio sp. D431a]|uniref:OmpA family protein n=1 Tax=Vibrio sp. D431a TaxID=2837388 RepID=UPI002553D206|nr:OmpA family protein [Vibrio sp. D431a]MDK9793239.1 OmpA family protein [Vibrio sp. D431a]
MKYALLLPSFLLSFAAFADTNLNEENFSKKISNTTEVYGNGLTSALLLAKFSKYQPIIKNDDQRLSELESLYMKATFDMEKADIAHKSEINEIEGVVKRTEEVNERYKAELETLREGLAKQLSLGELEQSYYYETAEWELTDEQYKVLSMVFDAVSEMPEVKIKVTGRADPRGNKAYNQTLSEKRAMYIRDMAVAKGILASQIEAVGIGEVGEVSKNREKLFFNRYTSVVISK